MWVTLELSIHVEKSGKEKHRLKEAGIVHTFPQRTTWAPRKCLGKRGHHLCDLHLLYSKDSLKGVLREGSHAHSTLVSAEKSKIKSREAQSVRDLTCKLKGLSLRPRTLTGKEKSWVW